MISEMTEQQFRQPLYREFESLGLFVYILIITDLSAYSNERYTSGFPIFKRVLYLFAFGNWTFKMYNKLKITTAFQLQKVSTALLWAQFLV